MVETYKNAIRQLWRGKCTVSILENVEDESTGRMRQNARQLFADVPCRISFEKTDITAETDHATRLVQRITLFIASEYVVPAGSIITVTQAGVTAEYEQSGVPAVYSTHQEIPLTIKKEWA